jgi:hypothetical protein
LALKNRPDAPAGVVRPFLFALSLKRSLTLKKLIIKSKMVAGLLSALGGKDNAETLHILNKAMGHKYIRRWPAKNGKGWEYLYPKDFLRPVKALLTFFGFKEEKIDDDYTKNNIQKDYGADKKTFAAHVLEYFSNKLKWDTFFAKKENRDKYKTPQKSTGKATKKTGGTTGAGTGTGAAGPGGVLGDPGGGESKKSVDSGKKKGDNKSVAVNKSLMRKIWGMYSGKEGKDGTDRENKTDPGQRELPATPQALQHGSAESEGGGHGDGTVLGEADNGGNALQRPIGSGERSARDVRITKKQAKDIRQACLDLLNSKSDNEMTEEDKSLLRQYEGAGGLGSEDASVHGTLYEFYTPRTVTNKVWEIVDKYIPGAKSVLEPSAGIGRFAEDRPNDKFTLNEYDQTSSRISGILHPEAEIKQGAFEEMFKPGKDYTGKKYDVVIGNPPYGKYAGIWKGRGEGKGHNRYEEYFIDRGLDTLREGGIMAFVVPSSFLRGGNDKIKEKIAGKGRLLEAWRLPNGTFNTTGVGTDVIIVRKEKGDAAAFSNNAYFEKNLQMVVGDETTRVGRFGEEKYVGLKDGETFDEAIEGINAGLVEAIPIGEQTTKDKTLDKVEVEESETEKHKNRSDAMKGNDNARKYGTLEELNAAWKAGKASTQDIAKELRIKFDYDVAHPAMGPIGPIAAISGRIEGKTLRDWEFASRVIDMLRAGSITKEEAESRLATIKFAPAVTQRILSEGKKLSDSDEKLRNLSDAMKGNDNAKKDGGPAEKPPAPPLSAVDTLEEFNRKYNKHFDPRDLKIMRHTRWDGTIDFDLLTPEETKYLKASGNYVDIGDNA